jgi:hypothetical protein
MAYLGGTNIAPAVVMSNNPKTILGQLEVKAAFEGLLMGWVLLALHSLATLIWPSAKIEVS